MKSKLIVNLDGAGKPCINVVMPTKTPSLGDSDFNLADRTLGMFFEALQHESAFLGVVRHPDTADTTVRIISPLTIPEVIEWLCVFFRTKYEGKSESSPEEVLKVFNTLKEMYFNEGRFGCSHNPKVSAVDVDEIA